MAPLVCQEPEGERLEDHGQEEFRKKHEDESPEVAQNVKIFTFMLTNPLASVHHRRSKQTGRQDDLFN